MRNKIFFAWNKLIIPIWSVPLVLLSVSFLAFGLLAPKLGFYMDDWHFVHYAFTRGIESLKDVLFYDSRPYGAWFYIVGFKLLGFKPISWHILSIVLRWATALIFWVFFNSLWPKYKHQALYISLFFVVYPFFLLQPMPVAYSIHWFGFFLYALSLWLMIVSKKHSKKKELFIVSIALLAECTHLFTSEYFSGLELLRPLFLWIVISRLEKNIAMRIRSVFITWFPYFVVWASYFYWRIFVFQGPPGGDRNTPVLLYQLVVNPIRTTLHLFSVALKDAVIILFRSWYATLGPEIFEFSSLFARFVFVVVVISFFSLYFFMNKLNFQEDFEYAHNEKKKWRKGATIIGLAALFLGEFPLFIIDKAIATHTNQMAATRFGMASMLGAALLLIVLLDYFVTDRRKLNAAVALGVALAVGLHLNNGRSYQHSWDKQKNLYQQLVIRVPGLEPDTAIIAAEEILPFMGEYPTSFAMNTIYSEFGIVEEETPYWFFSIYSTFYGNMETFLGGMPMEKQKLLSDFSGRSDESLFISYEPGREQCLWVLRPEDAGLRRIISELEQSVSLNSAVERIDLERENTRVLPVEIFGVEILQNWCSYYQRADLARQREEWPEITNLWEEAQVKDKKPENGFEYIPFIEGYAHEENWMQVKVLTKNANKVSHGMASILCSTLSRLEEATPSSGERTDVIESLGAYLGCQN